MDIIDVTATAILIISLIISFFLYRAERIGIYKLNLLSEGRLDTYDAMPSDMVMILKVWVWDISRFDPRAVIHAT